MPLPYDDTFEHPLADELVVGGVVHHDPALLLELTPLRSDLLLAATRASRRVVLHSSASSRMSPALLGALHDVRGRWLAEDSSGLMWDGITGRIVDPDAPFAEPSEHAALAAPFASGQITDANEVVLAASVRHRTGTVPAYGALLETFTSALDAEPVAYGPHEPVTRPWDPVELRALLASRPDVPRLHVRSESSKPMRGSLLVRSTAYGTEEIVDAAVTTKPAAEGLAPRVHRALERASSTQFVLFAVVLTRPARSDLMRSPVIPAVPAPLAVLIGPPGLRDLGVDIDLLGRQFGATRIGRPRVPGLVLPFSGEPSDWATVEQVVRLLGNDRVAAAFGRARLPG